MTTTPYHPRGKCHPAGILERFGMMSDMQIEVLKELGKLILTLQIPDGLCQK